MSFWDDMRKAFSEENVFIRLVRGEVKPEEHAKRMKRVTTGFESFGRFGRAMTVDPMIAAGKGFIFPTRKPVKETLKGVMPDMSLVKIEIPEIHLPDIPKEILKIPEFPKITLPKVEIPSGVIQLGKLPDISMGADVLGGIELPGMDAFAFRNEEGDVNPLMLAALAVGGMYVIRKVT